MWISLIILIQFDHQNDYDQSSSSVRVVISMIEHPTYACNMSQRWPVLVGTQVFVIADIWICWFGRFVFVKPSLSHLQTSDKHINTCFGAVMDFSQNMFCIFRVLLSTFADICWHRSSGALYIGGKKRRKNTEKDKKKQKMIFKGFQHLCSSSSVPYRLYRL